MCGIAGYAGLEKNSDREKLLKQMASALRHRGPDDQGYFIQPGVGLAARRLSIIDLPGGHQPISNEDKTIHVVFNGEIYNYVELRADLEKRGHKLRTQGDTETLVHLYEDYGVEMLRFFCAVCLPLPFGTRAKKFSFLLEIGSGKNLFIT